MPTRTITVRGVADATLKRLRKRAEDNRRSLNSELLELLDAAAAAQAPAASPADRPPMIREAAPSYASPVCDRVDAAELAATCRRHHIRWLAVFGSHARGDARPDSDVDVIVEFEAGRTPGFGIVRVAEALRPLFGGRRIDLHTAGGLGPRVRAAIIDSAQTLYGDA